jgi:pimeloyl-ACP methyl ester carboxylesterase
MYTVVAINQRGYGKSDRPQDTSSYRLECLTADVAAAIKALGHERCHALVAHDWGGSVAWATAGMHGSKLFDRLIVMALPHTGVALTNVDSEQRKRSSYILLFQARGLAEALLTADDGAAMDACFRTGPAAVRNKGALTEADVEYYRVNLMQPGGATAMLRWYRAFMRTLTLSDQPGDAAVWRCVAWGGGVFVRGCFVLGGGGLFFYSRPKSADISRPFHHHIKKQRAARAHRRPHARAARRRRHCSRAAAAPRRRGRVCGAGRDQDA